MVLEERVVPWTASHGFKYEFASSTVEETVNFPVRRNNRYASGIHGPISFAEQLVECTKWWLSDLQSHRRRFLSFEDEG